LGLGLGSCHRRGCLLCQQRPVAAACGQHQAECYTNKGESWLGVGAGLGLGLGVGLGLGLGVGLGLGLGLGG
jgi:hypothetical protein